MAERVVKVVLSAVVADYKKNMQEAAKATADLGSQSEKLAQQKQAMVDVGTAGMAMGAAVAAGIGVAVAKFADFDQAMSYVAATGEDARDSIDALRQATLDAGAATVFSATEAANAIEEMAKAGLSAREILGGGLTGALDLAAAGGLEVADAAGIAATALKVFNLEGSDMSHVADLLAAGAGKAMGDVTDLSAALAQGGQVAAATGLSIEETTAGLAAFASQGLLGSDAGTSFKTMLQRLTPQSKEARDMMEQLGVSAYDASGNFVGLTEFAGNLQSSMRDLTPEARNAALSVMFGSDAVRAANVIYQEGEQGIREWISAVDDQGYAAETAATRLDNLIGDWEAFTGAMDTAFISMGQGADGPLRELVQGLTELVDGFNGLPDWAKQAAVGVAILTAGIGLVGGAALVAIPKIYELKVAMELLGLTGAGARAALASVGRFLMGPWGIALVAGAIAVNELRAAQDRLKTSAEEFQNVIRNAQGVDDLFKASDSAVYSLLDDAIKDADTFSAKLDMIANNPFATGFDLSAQQLRASLKTIGEELATTAQTDLPTAQKAFRLLVDEYKLTEDQQQQLLSQMGPYKAALQEQANQLGINVTTLSETENAQNLLNLAMGGTPDAAAEADAALAEMEEAAAEAETALDAAADALDRIAGTAMSMGEAKDAALSAINAMTEAAKAEGAAIDGTDQASIRLRDSMREVEQSSRDSAQAIVENGGSVADAQVEWQKGRDAVLGMLEAKGMDREEAIRWADQQYGSAQEVKAGIDEVYRAWLNLPENKQTKYEVEKAEAEAALDALKAKLSSIPSIKRITLESYQVGNRTVSADVQGQATGGPVIGPGTGTSDSILRRLSNGEHVLTAAEVQAAGGHGAVAEWRSNLLQPAKSSAAWVSALGGPYSAPQSVEAARPAPVVNVNVYPVQGMSEAQVATIAADKVGRELRGA